MTRISFTASPDATDVLREAIERSIAFTEIVHVEFHGTFGDLESAIELVTNCETDAQS